MIDMVEKRLASLSTCAVTSHNGARKVPVPLQAVGGYI